MRCCPHARKDWDKVCCCCPIALGVLVISLVFIAWGSTSIFVGVRAPNFSRWESIVPLIVGILKVLLGICGCIAVILRNETLAKISAVAHKICLTIFVSQFFVQWIVWICLLSGILTGGKKWKPTTNEIFHMVSFTLYNLFLFSIALWILSIFRSFHMIVTAGGTGWERKNYKDIKLDAQFKNQPNDDA